MNQTKRVIACWTTAIMICLLATAANAQTPYGWRGAERNGTYNETGLLKTWPAAGPQLLWETMDVGKGYSSPLVVGDRLYITGMNADESKEIFTAFSLDGKKLYSVEYGLPWGESYPETRTTPAIEGDKAYMISGGGEVVCLNIKDGSVAWKVDARKAFGGKTSTWGTSECPLVFDNKVIYTVCGDQTTMVALNAETGETVWKSPTLNEASNYVSPMLISINGTKKIVGVTATYLIGVHPETGNIEWKYGEWGQNAQWGKISPNTPIYHNGQLFFSSGYDIGSFLLQLNADGSDVSLVWRNDDLDTHIGGYVLVDGTIYGSNWVNNTQGNWVAVDWASGKTTYNEQWSGGKSKGAIIAADGMLYCYDERRGFVGLVKPNPAKFEAVSEFRITKGEGPHWAHPVINAGVLYIRHGNALMAYKIK